MSEAQDARSVLDQAERAALDGDLGSADELLRNAVRIQEAELGPLHPDLVSTLNNLGVLAEKTGRPGDAEAFYRRAAAIASASLPPDHPIVADSRKNLEDFCRERGLPIDAAIVTTPPAPHSDTRRRTSRAIAWGTITVIVLVAAVLLVRRASPSRETPPSKRTESATVPQAAEPAPPPPVTPAPVEQAEPPKIAPRRSERGFVAGKRPARPRSAVPISLATTQLCQTFSTRGGNWKCDQAGASVSRGPIVLYTRVKSSRTAVIVHRWYRGNTLRQSTELTVRANTTDGYRTFSRLTINDVGNWRVEVRSTGGDLLYEQRFAVR